MVNITAAAAFAPEVASQLMRLLPREFQDAFVNSPNVFMFFMSMGLAAVLIAAFWMLTGMGKASRAARIALRAQALKRTKDHRALVLIAEIEGGGGELRQEMKEAIEDTGRHVVHELERFLGTLGTIAAVSPLLGLLGTVTGMIQAFEAISAEGVGDPKVLAGGIGTALITTAAGLIVAIPSLFAYRYLRGVVDLLVVDMEKEAMKLVRAFDRLNRRVERGQRRRDAAS